MYASVRNVVAAKVKLPGRLKLDARLKMDGLELLAQLPPDSFAAAFFDPQYRGVLDKLGYGNEGKQRGKARAGLAQMNKKLIGKFMLGLDAALMPGGHLFLWMDKFHLCSGFAAWLTGTQLQAVDMLTWHKARLGMGYRTRRTSEHLVVLQKSPKRAKGVWQAHDIPDVWREEVARGGHPHQKPLLLQGALLAAVTNPGDVVLDPAAGSFSVLQACRQQGRRFLGCDLNG